MEACIMAVHHHAREDHTIQNGTAADHHIAGYRYRQYEFSMDTIKTTNSMLSGQDI